jgi:hypothetical protein
MKLNTVLFSIILFLGSCAKEDELTTTPTVQDVVILESGFESNGAQDLSGWNLFYDYYAGVSYDTLVSSDCPDGGNWALNLKAQRLHYSYAERYLTNISGPQVLNLNFYATLYAGQNSLTATIAQVRNGIRIDENLLNTGTWNYWKQFSVTDTFNLLSTDTILIRFQGTGSTYESSESIIDRIKVVLK